MEELRKLKKSLKSKYTEVMKISKLLEKQSSEGTRESDLEGRLIELAGYNAVTGEQNACTDNIPTAGGRKPLVGCEQARVHEMLLMD